MVAGIWIDSLTLIFDGLGDFDEIAVYGSDPFGTDSDNDWIPDGLEANVIGSDPMSGDTDGDGYPDLFEYAYSDLNPAVPGFLPSEVKFDPCKPDMSPEKRALEFSTGALAGDYYVQDHDNLYYLSGWMAVGFVPVVSDVADVRDLFASVILRESGSNIALNGLAVIIDVASDLGYLSLIGAIPGYLASTISTEVDIGLKFLGHHPKFMGDVLSMIFIVAKLDNNIDTQVKAAIQAFDKVGINGEDFYTYLKGRGVSDTQFVEWSKKLSPDGAEKVGDLIDNGHSVQEIDYVISKCNKVEDVEFIKSGEHQFYGCPVAYWLEKGGPNFGDVHIDGRHISGTDPGKSITSFWPMGHKVRANAPITENKMNMDELRTMIKDSLEYGAMRQEVERFGNVKFVFEWTLDIEQFGVKKVRTVVGSSGNIITSYPLEGSSVLHYSDKLQQVI